MRRFLETPSPAILDRLNVCKPFITGISSIDSLNPIGKGQKQLIIGDRNVGKTTAVKTFIIAQKIYNRYFSPIGRGALRTFAMYAAIGLRTSEIFTFAQDLKQRGAMYYTAIFASPASDFASAQVLCAFRAQACGEFVRDAGQHAVVAFDSLTNHAIAFRQISLLIGKAPAREAYPGDIFYLHARLLERAAQLNLKLGGGTLTNIPIVETQQENISAYIPTNIISITDEQIYLSKQLFKSGIRPAVDITKSVSRVGSKAQGDLLAFATKDLKQLLIRALEIKNIIRAGQDLTKSQRILLKKAEAYEPLLLQKQMEIIPYHEQVLLAWLAELQQICLTNANCFRIILNNQFR